MLFMLAAFSTHLLPYGTAWNVLQRIYAVAPIPARPASAQHFPRKDRCNRTTRGGWRALVVVLAAELPGSVGGSPASS